MQGRRKVSKLVGWGGGSSNPRPFEREGFAHITAKTWGGGGLTPCPQGFQRPCNACNILLYLLKCQDKIPLVT
jgi:hypothetical protein